MAPTIGKDKISELLTGCSSMLRLEVVFKRRLMKQMQETEYIDTTSVGNFESPREREKEGVLKNSWLSALERSQPGKYQFYK